MTQHITDSQFYIWRTLFAVAHADDIVTDEEVQFMAHVMEDVDFTEEQTTTLKDDVVNPKDPVTMFHNIAEQKDRALFFDLARDLVWVDGDFDEAEQTVMVKLHKIHIRDTNVDNLVGNVGLELEEEISRPAGHQSPKKTNFFDVLNIFKNRFSNDK